jgi:protocatechuate 3,4-dioxygenase, beta subunit
MRTPTPSLPDFHLHDDQHAHAGHSHHPSHAQLRVVPVRRQLIGAAACMAGAALVGAPLGAFAQAVTGKLRPTPLQTLGPFYPTDVPADQDADMTVLGGNTARAQGVVVYVSGRVIDINGAPVPNAVLDIWQANAAGRYDHPADVNAAPLDANFQGFARVRADAEGNYRFKSIKPGAYPTGVGDWVRPPHVHFDVRGKKSRVVTQMYFEGEPLNEKDSILKGIRDQSTVVAKVSAAGGKSEKDALDVRWDVVLISG